MGQEQGKIKAGQWEVGLIITLNGLMLLSDLDDNFGKETLEHKTNVIAQRDLFLKMTGVNNMTPCYHNQQHRMLNSNTI